MLVFFLQFFGHEHKFETCDLNLFFLIFLSQCKFEVILFLVFYYAINWINMI